MSKYNTLAKYLANLKVNTKVLFIDKIETILGFPLPNSAKEYHAWWANDKSHTQARAGWLQIGWRVSGVDFETKQITFVGNPNNSHSILDDRSTPENGSLTKDTHLAQRIMSSYFDTDLSPRMKPNWPRLFDLVSSNYTIVGNSKRYSILDDDKISPSYLSSITEHIWMLEKISAKIKFLVFGEDKRVPKEWLKRYGNFNTEIEFYFIHKDRSRLERLFKDIKGNNNDDIKLQDVYKRAEKEIIEHKEPRLSDQIRDFTGKKLIEPARRKGEKEITIRTGDVHSKMGLRNRMPAVCSALKTKKFLQLYNIILINEEGPPQGANVVYTYKIS